MKKNSFKFTESKRTDGIIKHLQYHAEEEGRSLNDYVGRVLHSHLEDIKNESKDNQE